MILSDQFRQRSSLLPDELCRFLSSRTTNGRLGIVMTDKTLLLNTDEAELSNRWLSPEKHAQLNRYSFAKRRSEWFLGRICAKQAVIDLLSRLNTSIHRLDISIGVSASGRPFVILPDHPELKLVPDISISHSGDKVIGIAAGDRCGVDIQLLTDTLVKVRDQFCSEADKAVLASISADELVRLGMLWVAKESIRKCLGGAKPVRFLKMHLVALNHDDQYRLLDFQVDEQQGIRDVSVVVHLDEDYSLGVCTIARERIDA